ncbi:MAG: dihydroorotase [Ichthyobacteriaceae bacterium]|nr:dihydroorotase [Ichthyobacteriaceae bacterium]
MKFLIKNATIVDSSSNFNNNKCDILIDNGEIVEVSENILVEGDVEVIEKENLHVSPGWFDATVSFGEPGFEENETIETGLNASAKGGFTAVGVLPNTNPTIDNKATVEYLKNQSVFYPVNIYPIGAMSKKREGKEISETFDMLNSGAIAFGDDKPIENERLFEVSLLYNRTLKVPVLSKPDTEAISHGGQMNEGESSMNLGLRGIPNFAEELRVSRDIFITEYTEGIVHFQNISTKKSVSLIKEAKNNKLNVTAQVAAHNLLLNDSALETFDTRYKVMPPLRTNTDIEALINGIKDGVIDMVSSDHRPKDIERKFKEFDHASFGTIGLESCFATINKALNNKVKLDKIIDLICHNSRKRFGLKIPTIKTGVRAELTLFNPDKEFVFNESCIKSKSKNSALLGAELKGEVYGIFAKSKIILN